MVAVEVGVIVGVAGGAGVVDGDCVGGRPVGEGTEGWHEAVTKAARKIDEVSRAFMVDPPFSISEVGGQVESAQRL